MDPSRSSQPSSSNPGTAVSTVIESEQSGAAIDFSGLFKLAESLLEQPDGAQDVLCAEVGKLAYGRARLQLFRGSATSESRETTHGDRAQRLPVMCNGYTYGILWVMPISEHPPSPPQQALADSAARDLAKACGYILFALEQAALVRVLSRDLPVEQLSPLTNRQHQVLQLYAQGYGDQEIADLLCISPATLGTHRRQIYARLGVHHLDESLLLAHNLHLVSYLPESR